MQGFYSDLLYQPWHCANVPLKSNWLKRDTIDRRLGLTLQEFREQYEVPNKPVILQGAVRAGANVLAVCGILSTGFRHAQQCVCDPKTMPHSQHMCMCAWQSKIVSAS